MTAPINLPKTSKPAHPKMELREFGRTVVAQLIGRKLTETALDKTMIISSLMAQAVKHYEYYDAELQAMRFTLEDVLPFLPDWQADEIRASKNKQDKLMAGVREIATEVKKRNQLIINMLRDTEMQMKSARPEVKLKIHNLERADQGLNPLKRLPKHLKNPNS